jgi:pimeloyl-ACP methyl ester carboxylesterase
MYYEVAGSPTSSTLLLLHGFGQSGCQWVHQIAPFSERYHVLAPDLREHGRTNNPGGRVAMNHRQFAADIATFCDVLGIDRAAFCGESSGSILLLTLALTRPDLFAAAVLSAGTYFWTDDLRGSNGGLTVDGLAKAFFGTPGPDGLPTPAFVEFASRHAAQGDDHWRTLAGDFIAMWSHPHGADFPAEEELRRIEPPILLVQGDRDPTIPVERADKLRHLLQNAELCVLPNTRHDPPAEQPSLFSAVALDFLGRHFAAPPDASSHC